MEADSENLKNVGLVLRARIKEWLAKQLNNSRGESKLAHPLLSVLNSIVIFDCTI